MIKNKIDELTKKLDTLYDDRFKKNISLETYIRLSKNIENEIKSLNQRIKEFVLPEQKSMDKYKILAQEIIDFKNNPRPLLFQLIKKIEVDKNKVIRINYNFKI